MKYKVCLKSIQTEVVFYKREINNEWNTIQNSPFANITH